MVLRTEVIPASIIGGIGYTVSLRSLRYGRENGASFLAMTSALFIRLSAIKWHLSLPAFDLKTKRNSLRILCLILCLILFQPSILQRRKPTQVKCHPEQLISRRSI